MIEIGAFVRNCRKYVGMSQEEVVFMAGCSLTQQELSLIESGKRPSPSFEKVYSIIQAMGLELSVHENIQIESTSDLVRLRKNLKVSIAEIAKLSGRDRKTVRVRENKEVDLGMLKHYLEAMDAMIVFLTKELDINEFKERLE